jgi:hypothetical protein
VKKVYILAHPEARRRAMAAVAEAAPGDVVEVKAPNRTLEQNAAQWPILACFSTQIQWPVNGQMVWMTEEEWKDVLTAGFKREKARLAMGLDGGVVMLGQRTSKFDKPQFSEWLEFLYATAALRGVNLEADYAV